MAKANPTADEIHDERFTVKETLLEEYARLFAPAAAVDDTDYSWSNYLSLAKGDNPAEDAEAQRQWLKRHERELSKHPRSAICLSGGGVRSAAFCLGALQALANEEMGTPLTDFHYLSTVSGGGYTGGWLSALAWWRDGIDGALDALRNPGAPDGPMQRLRDYTNFLTPRGGLGSADTWAAVMLWFRNTILNWLIFGPALLALALLPVFYRALLAAPRMDFWIWLQTSCLIAGLLLLGFATFRACLWLPSHQYSLNHAPKPNSLAGKSSSEILQQIILPIAAWAALGPIGLMAWSPTIDAGWSRTDSDGLSLIPEPAVSDKPYMVEWIVALGLAAMIVQIIAYWAARWRAKSGEALFAANFDAWYIGCAVAGIVLSIGAWLAHFVSAPLIAVLGPPWVIAAHELQSTVFIALRRGRLNEPGTYADLDREWLARLNGQMMAPVLTWAVLSASALLLPVLVIDRWQTSAVPSIGLLSGPAAALIGKSMIDEKPAKSGWLSLLNRVTKTIAVPAATLLFVVALFMLLGRSGASLVDHAADLLSAPLPFFCSGMHPEMALVGVIVLFLFAWWAGARVTTNNFSMLARYRNRLIRAFLGSARWGPKESPSHVGNIRSEEPYTRFDARDNLRMVELFGRRNDNSTCLFPVINVTLNFSVGAGSTWSERKAAPFTITPLRCGAASLHRLPFGQKGDAGDGYASTAEGAYVWTRHYGGSENEWEPAAAGASPSGSDTSEDKGFTLGTAITISGSAVSPTVDFHSSPATAFLMMLFNVRLGDWIPTGAWMPNPARETSQATRRNKPRSILSWWAREMAGFSDESQPDIYLSDGGHFDKLGLYEMLRRKCRIILVIDADSDPEYRYSALGVTLRRAAIDLGVEVKFDRTPKIGREKLPLDGAHATIDYHGGKTGQLFYLKPWKPDQAPLEVFAYGAANDEFPHDATANQYFTESQFESYRELGAYLMGSMMNSDEWRNRNAKLLAADDDGQDNDSLLVRSSGF